jgi:hypothetical protein
MKEEPRRANRGNRYHNEKSEGITPNKLLEAKKERERIRTLSFKEKVKVKHR